MVDRLKTQHRLGLHFQPHPLVRNPHFQTIAPSLRRGKAPALYRAAQEMILDAGQGVRLQGFYSPQPANQSKGLVLMLHGWLGSAEANYVLIIGEYLYRHGYSVFRLNLRDHGDTQPLNPGIFRGDLLDEVFVAGRRIAQLEKGQPFHLVGASLGGNFVLRLAWRHHQTPLPYLNQTIAINPALNPHATTICLDTGLPIYLNYFRRKWRAAFKKKQAAHPTLYDFSDVLATSTCMAMTEQFVRHYSPYPDAITYFAHYTITPEMMAALRSPVTIITAADDPIVPVADFYPLRDLNSYLQLYIQPYGGHVGFIDIFPFQHWMNEAVLAILESG